MRSKLLIIILASLMLLWGGICWGQQKASGIPQEHERYVEVEIDKTKVSPHFRQILELEEKAAEDIRELVQKAKVSDRQQMAELQIEAERIKRELRIAVLQLRLEIAREKDDLRNVQEIETAMYRLQNPTPVAEDLESKAAREAQLKSNGEK